MERQFTRQAENALKLAKTTARSCGHSYIGTEHLLAGLLKEPEGTAGKVLEEFHVEEEKLMELISQLIAPAQGEVAVKGPKNRNTVRDQEGFWSRHRKMHRAWTVYAEQNISFLHF